MNPEVEQRFEKIEAILKWVAERQAAAEARAARSEARMDHIEAAAAARATRAEARMDRLAKRAAESDARFEKWIRGFEKLVKIGICELAEQRRRMNALIDSQQRTEASLRAFLDSRRARN